MSYRDDLALKLQTYSGEQMVMLLYEAMIENLEQAKIELKHQNTEGLDKLLDHNREILAHLNVSLGEEHSEMNDTTRQLYLYVNRLMTKGRIKMSEQVLDEAIRILLPLKEGWRALAEQLMEQKNKRSQQDVSQKSNIYTGMTYGKNDIHVAADSKDWDKG